MIHSQNNEAVFPDERLSALVEENAQMKVDLETKLEKLNQYKFLLDEYKRALDDEIKKSNQYKQLIN